MIIAILFAFNYSSISITNIIFIMFRINGGNAINILLPIYDEKITQYIYANYIKIKK